MIETQDSRLVKSSFLYLAPMGFVNREIDGKRVGGKRAREIVGVGKFEGAGFDERLRERSA